MTSIILALALSALNCGPLDQKKFPQYCSCVNTARNQYQSCFESELPGCEMMEKDRIFSCQNRVRTKCSKQHQLGLKFCNDAFPPRK